MECKLCANNSEHGPGFCCFLGCGPGVGASGAFAGTPGAGHIEYGAWAHAAVGARRGGCSVAFVWARERAGKQSGTGALPLTGQLNTRPRWRSLGPRT